MCALHHAKGDGGDLLRQGLQDCGFCHCHGILEPSEDFVKSLWWSCDRISIPRVILVCFQELAKLCII